MFGLKSALMNSVYGRITWAPPGEGGGDGGGDIDDSDIDTIPDSDEDETGEPGSDRSKIKDDDTLDMSEFFNAGDEDEDDDGESETPEQMAEAEAAMAEELKSTLSGLTLPDTIIPEDFDPSDRNQLHKLLADVQVMTATNAVRAMFKPVQATLVRMTTQLRREMRDSARSAVGGDRDQRLLMEEIPAAGNKTQGPMIRQLFNAAKAKHPKDTRAAIAATKKALGALGLNYESSAGSDSESGVREGRAALDGFGLRLPPPVQRTSGRLRR